MRFLGFAVVSSAILLGACGGGGDAVDTAATQAPAADTAAPAATTPTAAGTMAPITGTTHEVKMVGDDKGYRFEPADITIKAGDGIKFVFVSGGPHNIAFDPATIPADVKDQLAANMPNQTDLSSPMFMNVGQDYTISFANIKPGQLPYHCTPHLAMGMKGTITIQ